MKIKLVPAVICVLALVVSGCATATPQVAESPIEVPFVSPLDSPIAEVPTPDSVVIPFQLDRPLWEGATEVTGSGPPNASIVLEDVTFMGVFVGSGKIDETGRFRVVLPVPLEARHRIGLTIDGSDTTWMLEGFPSEVYHGEEALAVPQVGFYYDTAMVSD